MRVNLSIATTTQDPAGRDPRQIPLLGIYTKNPESPIEKNLCTTMFIAVLFTIAKCWKWPK